MRGRKRHLFSVCSDVLQLCLGRLADSPKVAFSGYDMYKGIRDISMIHIYCICAQNILLPVENWWRVKRLFKYPVRVLPTLFV